MKTSQSEGEIILDLSRLLSRVLHPTPTGIDRVEMAYARNLLANLPDRLRFAAVHPAGWFGRLDTRQVVRFLDATEERWEHRGFDSIGEMRKFAAAALFALRPVMVSRPANGSAIYLQASPANLTRPARLARILKRERARFACLVHDLIPLQYPEYARPKGAAEHLVRVSTISRFANAVLANSNETLATLQPYLAPDRTPIRMVAHLGMDRAPPGSGNIQPPAGPYFVCIATIEPRKNHLLLLNVWRRMAERKGSGTVPHLILIGRRGWENEQIVDMLERCTILKECVTEYSGLPDRDVRTLLGSACALLLPSFAEGYGLPVAEALASGIPVLCSDIPALREVGGVVPEYLDPLDGPGWFEKIKDYALPRSAAREAQLHRMAGWNPTTWRHHMAIVMEMLKRLDCEQPTYSPPLSDKPAIGFSGAVPGDRRDPATRDAHPLRA